MSTDQIIGDVAQTRVTLVPFNAVFTTPAGASGHGHFTLASAEGLRGIIQTRAFVRIVSQGLQVEATGPAGANKATTLHIGVVPTGLLSWPTSAGHVRTIGGSTVVRDSLYVNPTSRPLTFALNVAHQLVPASIVGEAPEVVYNYTIAGGAATDVVVITIRGEVEVDGVGFIQSW